MVVETLNNFARLIFSLLKSDRDVVVAVGGFTGEGKSTFSTLLQKEYSQVAGIPWDFSHMTWSRKEMMRWIDGDKKGKPDKNGLRPGQKPEFSAILPDELFSMFYRRNWFEEEQIDAIATFNMCRDRHLFVCGNVPNFWELDAGFTNRVRFYIYIPKRGVAWVFEQENNPFCSDNWNTLENRKLFRKKKKPYGIPNFVCEIHYPDWNKQEKKKYLEIRNNKRLNAINDNKGEKQERYSGIKLQRDALIKMIPGIKVLCDCGKEVSPKLTNKDLADVTGISQEAIRLIRNNER